MLSTWQKQLFHFSFDTFERNADLLIHGNVMGVSQSSQDPTKIQNSLFNPFQWGLTKTGIIYFLVFLAGLAALYLPLIVTHCHLRIQTQRVTFDHWERTKIQKVEKAKRQKDKLRKRQKDRKTERQKDRKTERQKYKDQTAREFNILMSGQFHTLAMLF